MHAQLVMSNSSMPWTVTQQIPLSMEFSGQKYWSGMLFPPPGYLSDPGIEPVSCISCTGRQVLYQLSHKASLIYIKYK